MLVLFGSVAAAPPAGRPRSTQRRSAKAVLIQFCGFLQYAQYPSELITHFVVGYVRKFLSAHERRR